MRGRLIATASGCVKRLRAARPPRIIAALDRGGAMSALVTSRREGSLLYVALNRPEKRNAIQRELLLALVDAIAAAEREPDVRAVVVYGEGPVFSAGVDFGMLTGDLAGERALPFRTLIGDMQAALSRLEALEKPVVGALHRYVPGLALELALAFDLRVPTAHAELGLPEVRVRLVPDVGGTTRLVRTVGYARAKELVMTGRMIGAAQALAIGLVNQVVPPREHVAAAGRVARPVGARRRGRLRRGGYRNAVLGAVERVDEFRARVHEALAADPLLPTALAKVVPSEATVRIEAPTAVETLAAAAAPFIDRLAGGPFFVRLERRGLKGRLHTPTVERALGDHVWRALEARGHTPRVEFKDPDAVLVLETIGDEAGIAVITRALRAQHPDRKSVV